MCNDTEIQIEKITEDAVDICATAVMDTDFGRLYYPSVSICKKILKEGMQKDFVFVAKQHDTITGFIWFSQDTMFGKFPYLNLIFVFAPYRKQGVGQKLLTYFEKTVFDLYQNPKLKVFLVVKEENAQAIAFYHKNGYRLIGSIEGLFRASVKERLMMKYIRYDQSMEVHL